MQALQPSFSHHNGPGKLWVGQLKKWCISWTIDVMLHPNFLLFVWPCLVFVKEIHIIEFSDSWLWLWFFMIILCLHTWSHACCYLIYSERGPDSLIRIIRSACIYWSPSHTQPLWWPEFISTSGYQGSQLLQQNQLYAYIKHYVGHNLQPTELFSDCKHGS